MGETPIFVGIFDVFCQYLKNGSDDFDEILCVNSLYWYKRPVFVMCLVGNYAVYDFFCSPFFTKHLWKTACPRKIWFGLYCTGQTPFFETYSFVFLLYLCDITSWQSDAVVWTTWNLDMCAR